MQILFRAPRWNGAGKKTESARIVRALLNGTLVQDDAELTGPTRNPAWPDERPMRPLRLQGDHGWVAYRGIRWRKATL